MNLEDLMKCCGADGNLDVEKLAEFGKSEIIVEETDNPLELKVRQRITFDSEDKEN